MKQQVAPLQAAEVAIIRRKCGQFDVSMAHLNSIFLVEFVSPNVVYKSKDNVLVLCVINLVSFFSQVKQHEFREDFRKTAPFMFKSENVYEKLDKVS